MTPDEIAKMEARIKEEILEEMKKGRRTESKAQAANKELKVVLKEELGFDDWTVHRVVGAVNVFIKACSGERQLRSINEKLIEPVIESCLNILKTYLTN